MIPKGKSQRLAALLPEQRSRSPGCVYMLIEREFVRLQDTSRCMCKIGRAGDFLTRSGQYPRGSKVLVVLPCDCMLDTENAIKAAMCNAGFRKCDEVGCETFEGDRDAMIWTMVTTTLKAQIGPVHIPGNL